MMRMCAKEKQRGMTFFEVLVVMGIFVIVGGFSLFVSMETYRGSSFRSDRDLLVATLQRARAQAMNNVCIGACSDGTKHGMHIQSDKYIIFQTNSDFADRDSAQDAPFESNTSITKNPSTLDIVFSQLSGATTATTLTLTGGGHTSVISIGSEGQITWTN